MKNIHVLPTDKPSRLIFNSFHKSFCYQKEIDGMYINDGKVSGTDFWGLQKALNNGFKPQNIYITSDEKIKDVRPHKGKWHLEGGNILNKFPNYLTDLSECKLVIMTTDQDLIADGIEAIDDEFLEWFVKNPSCEDVEIIQMCRTCDAEGKEGDSYCQRSKECNRGWAGEKYKIIIQKEEPKQETLEEASEQYAKSKSSSPVFQKAHIRDFISGAKWQQERMYSEEEFELIANEMVNWAIDNIGNQNPQSGKKFDEVIAKYKNK